MGPPLHFFMTRLLFMEKDKVNSLKARSDKASVEIVVDNPRILPETKARSLPPIPFPPAAPASPVAVEGWKGIKVVGWPLNNNGKLNPPPVYTSDDEADSSADDILSNLKLEREDDDNTEITEEESNSAQFESEPKVAGPKKPQLFPANSARCLTGPPSKMSGSIGKKLGKSIQRPCMKKKGSRNSAGSLLGVGKSSGHKDSDNSGSSSGAED